MSITPRPEIEHLAPVPHGGFSSAHADDWIDFSSNVNPYGPSPRVWDALRDVPIGRHPDPRATPLRDALAEMQNVGARQLIVGNGSVDLIYHLAVAYLRARDRVLIAAPTFGEYAASAAIMGAQIVEYRARAENDFAIDVDTLIDQARACNPRFIFLCNPNNPTGKYLARDEIEKMLRACPDALLVLDEAFVRFTADAWDARDLLRYDNLLILRSLTKDYALTGLRVGYALASAEIIAAIEQVQPPWSVNAFAQAATVAALRDETHLRDSLAALARAKIDLVNDLTRFGLRVVPSATHFFLVQVAAATEFARRLREHKIVVRDGTSWGLPNFIRIATRIPEENARLVETIANLPNLPN
ncbi:MAG: histidinol-phosphate aminotransferase family protein [Chloroflexi bacterium]|nr:histidinol-phosphate aminotransferase family protein [Chloroflexota bacterium]